MSRLLARALFLVAAAALVPASPALAARGFRHGVAAGEVISRSAVLWAHANRSGGYTLQVARKRRFGRPVKERRVRARRRNDNTVQARVGRLRPGTALLVPLRPGRPPQ
jgi:phosphodiesterase/alkaline phosphatase D-like protein